MAENTRDYRIEILQDTLQIIEQGYYRCENEKIPLRLSKGRMEQILVYLPEDVKSICNDRGFHIAPDSTRCVYDCVNMDTFTLAQKRYRQMSERSETGKILVLNLANPVHPGGGVRRGARAQEEDLCRRSTLLQSLESRSAKKYYDYNRSLNSNMGSDAVMITPEAEVFKDENGLPLKESFVVSVMTCAAPNIRQGLYGMSEEAYEAMLTGRIRGMLMTAAHEGYRNLILGAFGCGAFGNDARIVAGLFYKVLKEFDYNGFRENDCFDHIDFAVLSHSPEKYNFNCFFNAFNDFYQDVRCELSEETNQRRLYDDSGVIIKTADGRTDIADALLHQRTEQIFEGMHKYMPAGSVVSLKNSEEKKMIIGFRADRGSRRFDYTACDWPIGIDERKKDNGVVVFDHDQIKSTYHVGYQNLQEKAFKQELQARDTAAERGRSDCSRTSPKNQRPLISILGDSISTYTGFNPAGYRVFYEGAKPEQNGLESVYDTWWAKVNQHLHAYLCVNNSYSGSTVSGSAFPAACSMERTSALHHEKYRPDIILVYIGHNDFGRGVPIAQKKTLLRAQNPNYFLDACLLMLERIRKNYPDAKIICATLMRTYMKDAPSWIFPETFAGIPQEDYNKAIRQACSKQKCIPADLAQTGAAYETLDGSHPTKKGHLEIANAWIRVLDRIRQDTGF